MHAASFAEKLLAWFDQHARPLPWRTTRDPYAIWISEVMLQQTQVVTVVGYFARFLERFPTIADLARAEESDVLRLWEGLGYYSRGRNLHAAARRMVAENGGEFPRTAENLRTYPGLGRYTTNAVLSQAYDLRLPILEANSVRLLCRLFGVREDPKAPATQKKLWALAEDLLPERRAGDFNQALMELGALVCSPRAPSCLLCPLSKLCKARELGLQESIPLKAQRPKIEAVQEVTLVIRKRETILLGQRPKVGRWANLWEFPRRALAGSLEETAKDLAGDLGLTIALGSELATIKHGVTRYRIELACWEATWRSGQPRSGEYQELRWVKPMELPEYPLSRPQRRLTAFV